jgi:hypothetical protein
MSGSRAIMSFYFYSLPHCKGNIVMADATVTSTNVSKHPVQHFRETMINVFGREPGSRLADRAQNHIASLAEVTAGEKDEHHVLSALLTPALILASMHRPGSDTGMTISVMLDKSAVAVRRHLTDRSAHNIAPAFA